MHLAITRMSGSPLNLPVHPDRTLWVERTPGIYAYIALADVAALTLEDTGSPVLRVVNGAGEHRVIALNSESAIEGERVSGIESLALVFNREELAAA